MNVNLPEISLFLHSEADCWVDAALLLRLESSLRALLPVLLEKPKGVDHVLSMLEDIELSLVDDAAIAAVHGEFFDDPTPTDVITFHHGEILVSYDTARRYAEENGLCCEEEIFRYLVHGLVHLHGYLDALPEEREGLFAVQEPLVKLFWPARQKN